jgi:YVTN family beta-propeller protein
VIDGAANRVLATVRVGSGLKALCCNPQNNKVYCASFYTSDVAVIDGITDTVLATVRVPGHALELCYNPVSNKVYCSYASVDTGYSGLAVIDGSGDSLLADIPMSPLWQPWALCHDSIHNKVYCADYTCGHVVAIDGVTNAVVCSLDVGWAPIALAWSPASNRVYVANAQGSSISVIRTTPPGVEESFGLKVLNSEPIATVVRGVLFLPEASSPKHQTASLLDISGRKAMDLRPGANDVRALAPGVYFVREAQARGTRKVVITR